MNPVFHRAADRGAVAAAVGEHILAAFLAEGMEAPAAQQFHEHQRCVDVAHAHALGDALPQALVGGGEERWGIDEVGG